MIKLPKQSMHGEIVIGQHPLIEGRSPALIKSANKQVIDQRGKTFTATRLGNFPNGKNDQQFFYYKGDNSNNGHSQQQQQQMRITKTGGLGSTDLMMNTTNSQSSSKQRVFVNNNPLSQQALSKEPISPSKRSQNYAVISGVAGTSSRKASVNQRSPLLSSSFQQAANQVNNSAGKQSSNTRDSYHFRSGISKQGDPDG